MQRDNRQLPLLQEANQDSSDLLGVPIFRQQRVVVS
jgi:hypothetical protein